MNEIEQKKLASKIVLKAIKECNEKRIDPYIRIGSFIYQVIRELAKQNDDDKIAKFLETIAEKVKNGIYSNKN